MCKTLCKTLGKSLGKSLGKIKASFQQDIVERDVEKPVENQSKSAMRSISAANRGKTFETFIAYANRAYRTEGIAIVEKQYVEMLPIRDGGGRIITCKIGEKSTVDYLGRLGNIPLAVEAKDTRSGFIRFDAVQDHQMRFLEDFTRGGVGIGLVLVSFNLDRFFAIPAPFWQAARQAWAEAQRKNKRTAEKITITHYGQTWTTPGKASVRPEELYPTWECTIHRKYGLHYLEGAERYIDLSQFLK